MIICPKLSLK